MGIEREKRYSASCQRASQSCAGVWEQRRAVSSLVVVVDGNPGGRHAPALT